MEFEKTSLYQEVLKIDKEGSDSTAYLYTAAIKVVNQNQSFLIPKVISLDIQRDYVSNFADKTIIRVAIPGGLYAYRIFPNLDDLEVALARDPIYNTNRGRDLTRDKLIETYTAILVNPQHPTVNKEDEMPDEETLNIANLIEIDLELVSKTVEEIGMISVGGIFRNTTTEEVVKTIMSNENCTFKKDKNLMVKGVDMIESSTKDKREHIMIPHGTRLIDIPNYIQKKCGGVYNSGMGYYLQDKYWYIYPAYDHTRIRDTERVVTFVNIPKNKLPFIERTFRWNDKQLIALATGDIKIDNPVDIKKRNTGNGVSFTLAKTVLHDMVTTGGDKATINRKESNTEAKTSDRKDGKVYMPVSSTRITDNSLEEFSKIAETQSGMLVLVWENSEPFVIKPGMMARVFYMDNDNVNSIVGVITGAQHYIHMAEKGITSYDYKTNSAITITVDTDTLIKNLDKPDLYQT